ncbi:MAG TPA: hypothetical protein PLI11_00790 [Clostridia bacterium]|nr:hypothetical protein [Clostridia bacterium]
MNCKNCGAFIKETDNFCETCERPISRIIPMKEKTRSSKNITILLILLIITFVSIGILLNISRIFGATDLGIEVNRKHYESAMKKFTASLKKHDGYTDIVLTNEEITSLVKYNWPENDVVKDMQVRINKNSSIEAAGLINKEYIAQYLLTEGNGDSIYKVLPMFDAMPKYTDVYAKFRCEIKNNRVNYIAIDKVEIMGIEVPESMYKNANTMYMLADGINQFIENVTDKTGASFDLVKAQSGKLIVKGLLPEVVYKEDLEMALETFSLKW